MPYKVRLQPLVVSQIQGWQLPDTILVEVNLFLREVLPADLEHNLNRESDPFDAFRGMTCGCTRRDHHVQGREHHFIFHVFFSEDEQFLRIENGSYNRDDGM